MLGAKKLFESTTALNPEVISKFKTSKFIEIEDSHLHDGDDHDDYMMTMVMTMVMVIMKMWQWRWLWLQYNGYDDEDYDYDDDDNPISQCLLLQLKVMKFFKKFFYYLANLLKCSIHI